MDTAKTEKIATEKGHWYRADGTPCHEVPRVKGDGMRPTTLADARKLGLVPSVTTILRVMARPGLEAWIQRQVLTSAVTLPRPPGASDEEYIKAIIEESREVSRAATDRGTALHAAIETRDFAGPWADHVRAVEREMKAIGLALVEGAVEKSFASPLGYGGKVDWYSRATMQGVVVDFKSKDKIEDGQKLVWDEHISQLAAYAVGLRPPVARCLNVFVGVADTRVVIVEHDTDELSRGFEIFLAALRLWQIVNRYDGMKS